MHCHDMMSVLPHNQNIQKLSSLDFSCCRAGSNLLFRGVLLPTPTSSFQANEGLRLLWKSFKPFPVHAVVFFFIFFFFGVINDNLVRRSAFQQWWTLLLQQLMSGHLGGTEGHRSCLADPRPVEGGAGLPAGTGQHVCHLLLLLVQHGELGA